MAVDPWSRPTLDDLRVVLESIGKTDAVHDRAAERLDLSVPAEVITQRGSSVPAMTREIVGLVSACCTAGPCSLVKSP